MAGLSEKIRPLSGLRIVITREAERAGELKEKLEKEGARAILFPTIKTVPVVKSEYRDELKKLKFYHWVVFTSGNAVKYFLVLLDKFSLSFPDEIKVAAIGSATAAALKKRGIEVDLEPEKAVGESLVESFAAFDLRGKRVFFPRAKVARELVAEELKKMGAEVKLLIVYETLPCADYLEEFLKEFEKGIDVVTFTSASTARNFYHLLEGKVSREKLASLQVICLGPVTAKAVEELGYQVRAVAKEYSTQGLVETLNELALNNLACS